MVGSAILSPSLSAGLSLSAGEDLQGTVAGLNSSALALGRMAGSLDRSQRVSLLPFVLLL